MGKILDHQLYHFQVLAGSDVNMYTVSPSPCFTSQKSPGGCKDVILATLLIEHHFFRNIKLGSTRIFPSNRSKRKVTSLQEQRGITSPGPWTWFY